jgi:hypothetical protein
MQVSTKTFQPTPALQAIDWHQDTYHRLGFSTATAISPTTVQLTVDPARSPAEAAALAAIVDPHPLSPSGVSVVVVPSTGAIDPMRASRDGIRQVLAGIESVRVEDSAPNVISIAANDPNHGWAVNDAAELNDVLRDVVTLPSIPGLPPTPPIELHVGARAETNIEREVGAKNLRYPMTST